MIEIEGNILLDGLGEERCFRTDQRPEGLAGFGFCASDFSSEGPKLSVKYNIRQIESIISIQTRPDPPVKTRRKQIDNRDFATCTPPHRPGLSRQIFIT